VTPPKTPSDILKRGPLYEESNGSENSEISDSSNEAEKHHVAPELLVHRSKFPSQSTSSALSYLDREQKGIPFRSRAVEHQIEYHRIRQEAISRSIIDFETKMKKLLQWHCDQERMLQTAKKQECSGRSGRSSSSGSSSTLRRGRSKLSEKLYAAIDSNSN
jgi:hypothetical protein